MADNILDFDEGYDAYELGEAFDDTKSASWKEGYYEAALDEQSQ